LSLGVELGELGLSFLELVRLVFEPRFHLRCGLLLMIHGLWFVISILWLWFVGYGLWFMAYGL
jgi:hypothetical protein